MESKHFYAEFKGSASFTFSQIAMAGIPGALYAFGDFTARSCVYVDSGSNWKRTNWRDGRGARWNEVVYSAAGDVKIGPLI